MRGLAMMVLAAALLALSPAVSLGNSVYWEDGDGVSGTITGAAWNDLQTAIDLAQGKAKAETTGVAPAGKGKVYVEGATYQRSAADATVGDLLIREKTTYSGADVTLPGVDLKGGYDASFTTQGAQTVLNVNGANTASNQYRVLQVSAPSSVVDNFEVTKGFTVKTRGGGIYVSGSGDNSTLQNLLVKDNQCYGGYGDSNGGGIAIGAGANGVRVSDSTITGNRVQNTGGGIVITNSGSSSAPVIIENCEIVGNWTTKSNYNYGGNSGGGIQISQSNKNPASRAIIANCKIEGNKSRLGSGISFGGWEAASRVVVFGSTITGNYWNSSSSYKGQGNGIYAGSRVLMSVLNCTVADNTHPSSPGRYGIYGVNGSWGVFGRIMFANAVVTDNDNGMYDVRQSASYGTSGAYLDFQNTTLDEANYYEYDNTDGNVNSTTFLAALTAGNPTCGYHSRNASGALSSVLEQNLEGAAGFLGAGEDPLDPYQLTPGSNSLNNGLAQLDAGGFLFVDADFDGNYDAMLDIIVAGTAPAGSHLVYSVDLLGNPRVDLSTGLIDRGAYELLQPVPEPTALGLLVLGLPLLKRRRRS